MEKKNGIMQRTQDKEYRQEEIRAVSYCRVSTEEESQLTSVRHQQEEALRVMKEQGWTMTDAYIDEGCSGTTTQRRTEYRRMIEDMQTGRFDIIVVKSQDRLMRNTRDWYLFLETLTKCKIRLYFYLEHRFYSPEDALLTGIRAILAEDFSRSLSKNINHAHERRQKSGSNVVLTSKTWGYDKRNKQVYVNDAEAKMIRQIFLMAANDCGSHKIVVRLTEEGYRNRRGGMLAEQTIRRIIRNPLYKGTAVMNRQHLDFETKQVDHHPIEQWIYHEGAVPAIVSEDLWQKANDRMDVRKEKYKGNASI